MAKIGMKQSSVLLTGFKSTRFDESSSKVFSNKSLDMINIYLQMISNV